MKPGRELDALVAEEVMGLDPDWHMQVPVARVTPYYSTDIAAAWEVVEEMRRRGYALYIEDDDDHAGIYVAFGHTYRDAGQHQDDTAPHAICIAALRAVGYEVD